MKNNDTKIPSPLFARSSNEQQTEVAAGTTTLKKDTFVVMAGPCAVESKGQVESIALGVHKVGVNILRGGAFKPRTSPYSFQGLEMEGLKYLSATAKDLGMAVVSEVMDVRDIPQMLEYVDIFQVGARNMQNFALLKELGAVRKPVLLKRGVGAKIDELLGAAEYILKGGNTEVILCERGIRTFEDSTRATLDISAVPVLKKATHLPVIVDPSHAAGRSDIVPAMALAACAAGADGIIVEVHNNPQKALCDGDQAISFEQLDALMKRLAKIAPVVGKNLG